MLPRTPLSLLLVLVVVQVEAKLNCLFNCTLSGSGASLVNVDGRCDTISEDYCEVKVNYEYHSGEYRIQFNKGFYNYYNRFIYILPTNYLSYTATFSCSSSDTCAVEFAGKKLADLATRGYDSVAVSQELAPLLNEVRTNGSSLRCYDGESCLNNGLCQIEYDTAANSQTSRGCKAPDTLFPTPKVSAYDGGSYTVMEIECNRTSCNSPDTMTKVKEILARHNITDANGRINGSSSFVASTLAVMMMLLLSKLFN